MKVPVAPGQIKDNEIQVKESAEKKELLIDKPVRKEEIKSELKVQIEKSKTVKPKKFFRRIPVIVIISIILIV